MRQQSVAAGPDDVGELALLVVERRVERWSVIPITAFIGVRISWLIVARKALFASVAASAASARWLELGRPLSYLLLKIVDQRVEPIGGAS